MTALQVSAWKIKKFSMLVSYFDKGQHYQFVYDAPNWRLEPISSPKLIQIIARGEYQETMERLPVVDKTALSGILKLKRQQNSAGKAWLVQHQDESSSYLNVWSLPSQSQTGLLALPESVLLAKVLAPADVTLVKNDYFIATQHNVIYSAKRFSLLPDAERFAAMVGVPFERANSMGVSDWANSLCHAFWRLSLSEIKTFFKPTIANQDKRALRKSAVVFGSIMASYLLLSSAWLVFQKNNLRSAIDENRAQINQSLSDFERLSSLNDMINQRDAVFSQNQFDSEFFALIAPLRGLAKIERLQTNNQRFVIRGKTTNALHVLESLSKMTSIRDPRFDEPVRSYQGQEDFVISFEMRQTPATPVATTNEGGDGAA